jgi:hypothetical protein
MAMAARFLYMVFLYMAPGQKQKRPPERDLARIVCAAVKPSAAEVLATVQFFLSKAVQRVLAVTTRSA